MASVKGGLCHGLGLRNIIDRVFRHQRGVGLRAGTPAGAFLSWVYILGGVLAAGIFVYLVVALLFPEKF